MTIETVSQNLIHPNPFQPKTRWPLDPASVQELADDIKANGLIHFPVCRRLPDGGVEIGVGHRRTIAYQIAFPGQPVPMDIRELSDRQMYDYVIAEGSHRLDWSVIEKGETIRDYIKRFDVTQTEAAKRFNLSQSAISNILNLLDLSPKALQLTHSGDVPQRLARTLVPLARIMPDMADQIASKISKAQPDERDDVAGDVLYEIYQKTCQRLGHVNAPWPRDWVPDQSAKIEKKDEIPPACKKCPMYLTFDGQEFCARKSCFDAKQKLWSDHELKRLTAKTGIPLAGPDEKVFILSFDYRHRDRVTDWIKNKNKRPDCLRLLKNSEGHTLSYHNDALGSTEVLIGTTNKGILDSKVTEIQKDNASNETEAEKKKRAAAEERERNKRREATAALHRAKYDILWLVMHTAEELSKQMTISGGVLELSNNWCERLTTNPSSSWNEYYEAIQSFYKTLKTLKGDERELLLRQHIMIRWAVHKLSAMSPDTQFDWQRAVKAIEGMASEFNLKLPKDFDKPPVHHTGLNCWVCGKFVSNEFISKIDFTHGWKVLASDELRPTCSDACRAKAPKSWFGDDKAKPVKKEGKK